MKKLFSTLLLIIFVFTLSACNSSKSEEYKIPDVFGINYSDAIAVLEAEGFEVNCIATGVDNISSKLLYPLETVEEGTVFKIEDYILDSHGNLNKNYDVFYRGELVSEDKSIIIYYAKETYIAPTEEDIIPTFIEENYTEPSEETVPIITTETTEATEANIPETTQSKPTEKNNSGIGSEFKAAMDSYEEFMTEYVSFMKKYQDNPGDLSLILDYTKYTAKYATFVSDFGKWDNEDLNSEEMAYYLAVQSRVTQKLLEIGM